MISRTVMRHHLSRFDTLSHLIEELMLDTDDDKMSQKAVKAVLDEWLEWCTTLESFFPQRVATTQVQRLYEQSALSNRPDSLSDMAMKFERTNALLKRLALIHDVEE